MKKVIVVLRSCIIRMIFSLCKIFPVDKNLIVFESEGDYSDNSYALYSYMLEHGYFDKYKAIWLVDKRRNPLAPVKCKEISKIMRYPNPRTLFYLATCQFFIFDHFNLLGLLSKRKNQYIINLWHGCAFKKGTASITDKASDTEDFLTVNSEFWKPLMAKSLCCSENKVWPLGQPRNDFLFSNNERVKEWLLCNGWLDKKNIFLWMPTFRKSSSKHISEEYYVGETGLPVCYSISDMLYLNEELKKINSILVIKVHHLQLDYEAYKNNYSNIKILKDKDIQREGFQLYEVIGFADCLITDYSSIYTDFLLLNKPIIFTIDDYSEYESSRGFSIRDSLKYYPGYHVSTIKELIVSLKEISDGKDTYKAIRESMIPLLNSYVDNRSCERIMRHMEKYDLVL